VPRENEQLSKNHFNNMGPTEPYLPQDKVFTADKKQYGKLNLNSSQNGLRLEEVEIEGE